MAPFMNANPPGEGEASDTGLIDEAPRPQVNCRDLGTKPMTEGDKDRRNDGLSRIISGLDESDAKMRYTVEMEDNNISSPKSAASSVNPPEKKIIHWEDGDPENPYNWSSVRLNYS